MQTALIRLLLLYLELELTFSGLTNAAELKSTLETKILLVQHNKNTFHNVY